MSSSKTPARKKLGNNWTHYKGGKKKSKKEDEYGIIDKILDYRKPQFSNKYQFKVHWQGFSEDGATWEPIENIVEEPGAYRCLL